MDIVDKMVTPITTNKTSFVLFLLNGKTDAIAKAAQAPQIATEPPASNPNASFLPKI